MTALAETAVPPLEGGDRLDRAEFARRYEAMPGVKKAELIEGVVFMPSPVRYNVHANPHSWLVTWLTLYSGRTPGTGIGDNGTVRLDVVNEPQPDAFLFVTAPGHGQARVGPDDYVEHAPELVAEVAASSVSIDLHAKFAAYQRAGVREYVVWRTRDRAIDWFVLRDEAFVPHRPDADGLFRSTVFGGLWLDPASLLGFDMAGLLDVFARGTSSAEHAAFVTRLATPPA